MEIHAIYSAFKSGDVWAAPVDMEGAMIAFASEPVRISYSADESEERRPVLIVDVKGLSRRELDDRLMTNMRFPGSDVWFLTHIRDVEDVFDCFMGSAVKVLVPYHTTRNDEVLREAFEVSENCMPVLFVSQGMVICRDEGTKDIMSAVSEIAGIGFKEIVLFDTDSMLGMYDWVALNNMFPGLIPFVRSKGLPIGDAGFPAFIVDL